MARSSSKNALISGYFAGKTVKMAQKHLYFTDKLKQITNSPQSTICSQQLVDFIGLNIKYSL